MEAATADEVAEREAMAPRQAEWGLMCPHPVVVMHQVRPYVEKVGTCRPGSNGAALQMHRRYPTGHTAPALWKGWPHMRYQTKAPRHGIQTPGVVCSATGASTYRTCSSGRTGAPGWYRDLTQIHGHGALKHWWTRCTGGSVPTSTGPLALTSVKLAQPVTPLSFSVILPRHGSHCIR